MGCTAYKISRIKTSKKYAPGRFFSKMLHSCCTFFTQSFLTYKGTNGEETNQLSNVFDVIICHCKWCVNFVTWDNGNPFPSLKKWWSEQLSITSNCFNWSEFLLSKETGTSFLSWILVTSQYGVMSSVDCKLLTRCSASGPQVSKSFLSRKLDPFPSSSVGTEETAPYNDVTPSVWNMLALMLEKSSKAAWGREKELLSPGCFSLSPLQSDKSWSSKCYSAYD